MKKIFYSFMLLAMPAMAQQTTVSTLEDTNVEFNEQGYWNGGKIGTPEEGDWGEDIYHCQWVSGELTGTVDYNYMDGYDWWSGIALSQSTSTAFTVLDDQYNNIVGGGDDGSKTFGVIYGNGTLLFNNKSGGMVKSICVANSAYTHNNFTTNTGAYDTKFTAKGDHIYLVIEATKIDGSTKKAVVKLAEYDEELTYLTDWTRIDLDSLGTGISALSFSFDCNKPMVATYACIDNIEVVIGAHGTATFENLTLEEESFWNGTDDSGSFVSGGYLFENGHEVYDYGEWGTYDYCYGFFYTNRTSTAYTGDALNEQYNSCVGSGAEESANYATYNLNTYTPKGIVVLGEAQEISGCYLTNNAYAYQSMKDGDYYAKKFGQGDWLKLTITGTDAEGKQTGSVDFYLADLRSENEATHYILDKWLWCDLTSLGKVQRLDFTMSSSDNGEYGMNTPAYFCMDNLGGEQPTPTSIASIHTKADNSRGIFDLNGRQLNAAAKGLNIVRAADGTVRKVIKN